MRTLNFAIDPQGNVKLETEGFEGNSCEEIAEKFAQLGQVEEKKHTEEYYMGNYNEQTERN